MSALVEIASPPLGRRTVGSDEGPSSDDAHCQLLRARNGFYAFESALHVLPTGSALAGYSLEEWNEPSLWIDAYDGLAANVFFFAEDVFGNQFGFTQNGVVSWDAETGAQALVGADAEEWARAVLEDAGFMTGWTLGHDWQAKYGALAPGQRLAPKVPFVLGGDFAVDNLFAIEAGEGMRLRSAVATAVRDHPDGSAIRYLVTE